MRFQTVPNDQQLLFEVRAQRFEELDMLFRLDAALVEPEHELRSAQPGNDRDVSPVEVELDSQSVSLLLSECAKLLIWLLFSTGSSVGRGTLWVRFRRYLKYLMTGRLSMRALIVRQLDYDLTPVAALCRCAPAPGASPRCMCPTNANPATGVRS